MKLRILITALFLAVFLVSCDTGTDKETEIIPAQPEILTNVYLGEEIVLPDGYSLVRSAVPLFDGESGELTFLCTCGVPVYDEAGTVIDTGSEYHIVTMDADFSVAGDSILPISEVLGGNAPTEVRFSDSRAVFLWSDYNIETGEKPIYLGIYDITSDETVYAGDITALFASESAGTKYFVIAGMETDRNGQIYVAGDEELMIFDKNGIKITQYTAGAWINTLALSSDGTVHVSGVFASGSGLYPIDPDSLAMKQKITAPDTKNMQECYFGEDYELYYVNGNVLRGLNGQTAEDVMSYENSNLSQLDILRVIDRDTVLALGQKSGRYYPVIYRKSPDIDLGQLKTIEIATADGLDTMDERMIVEYNKANPDRRVVVKDYSEEGGADRLAADILTGLYMPDIIEGDAESELMRQIVSHKLYADLNPYLDADERVNHENLFGGIGRTFGDGGKMWGITSAFSVSTMITQDSAVGKLESWTAEEMIDTALSLREDQYFILDLIRRRTPDNWGTEPAELFGPAGYGSFVDAASGTAYFDSPAFVKYLEFIKELPEKIDTSLFPYSDDDSYLFNQAEGRCAADTVTIESTGHWLWMEVLFNTKDYSIVGYPIRDKNSGYGSYLHCESAYVIMNDTEYPNEAWDAVKMFFPEYEDSSGMYYQFKRGFPALKSVMEETLRDDMNYEFKFRFSNARGYSRGWYDPENPSKPEDFDRPTKISYMTEEDADALMEFLDTRVGSALAIKVHDDITDIVNEEISSYLAGMGTAEECAKKIQSRAELWISEHE